MRIRLWHAYASNNSGSYTIVGSFREAARAAAVAEALAPVVAEHSAWLDRHPPEGEEPPLHRFIRARGLTLDERVGLAGDWPEHGPPPEVVAIGRQVLVHCDYTATMPRVFGELFFAEGGRVDVEIDHAHTQIVALFRLWVPWEREGRDAVLQALLEQLLAGPLRDEHTAVPSAWGTPEVYDQLEVGVVFRDLVSGARAVQTLADEAGVNVHVSVFEAERRAGDPLAFLRGQRRAIPGEHQVILWQVGPHPTAVLKVLRSLRGVGLTEARALLSQAPLEVVTDVNRRTAEAAALALREAGADVELIGPGNLGPA